MRKGISALMIIGLILCVSSHVAAIDIIDTGPGLSLSSGYSLYSWQWLSSEFYLDQAYVITDMYGWMQKSTGSSLTLAIYGDGGDLPDVSNEIFSDKFSVTPRYVSDWYGLTGLNWTLSPGTYWIAFEVRTGDTFDGMMPYPSSNPLLNEAYSWDGATTYYVADDLDIGVRIVGTPTIVPEPISSVLFVTGGVLLAGRRLLKCGRP